MEEIQKNIQNNLNLNNINPNNINFNKVNNKININENKILQFQSVNNNLLMNIFSQNNENNLNNNNYNNENNFQNFYPQNIFLNNINNNKLSQSNKYFQKEKQNQEKENKFKNKNFLKRANYVPKNLIFNQKQIQQNQNNQNQYFQNYYSNIYNDFQNMNPINNPENSNENQSNNNNYSIQENDIDNNFRNIITEIENDTNKISKEITNEKVHKIFTHIFNDSIEDVVGLLTDENFFKSTCSPDLLDNIQFPKSNFKKSGEPLIILRWKKFYDVKFLLIKQHWCKKHISYTLKLIEMKPANIGSMEINFKYYYNTCQNNTLYIIEFILDKGILSEVFKEELFDYDLNKLCMSCEKVLRERKKEKSHISSLIINSSKEKVWNNIINLNKNRYINYMNKYDLYYIFKDEINNLNYKDNKSKSPKNEIKDDNNNHRMQKGDTILIKKGKNEIFSKMVIDEIKEEKDKNELVLVCHKEENKSKNENNNNEEKKESGNINNKENIEVLNQKIIINIKEITKNMCFLEYKHIWEDWVNVNKIDTLNFLKINSLKKFKELFAEYNLEKNNNKEKLDNSVISIFNLLCPIEL